MNSMSDVFHARGPCRGRGPSSLCRTRTCAWPSRRDIVGARRSVRSTRDKPSSVLVVVDSNQLFGYLAAPRPAPELQRLLDLSAAGTIELVLPEVVHWELVNQFHEDVAGRAARYRTAEQQLRRVGATPPAFGELDEQVSELVTQAGERLRQAAITSTQIRRPRSMNTHVGPTRRFRTAELRLRLEAGPLPRPDRGRTRPEGPVSAGGCDSISRGGTPPSPHGRCREPSRAARGGSRG